MSDDVEQLVREVTEVTGAQLPAIVEEDAPVFREDAANSCALYYPMPDCPSGMACNPPRPQTIACPDH